MCQSIHFCHARLPVPGNARFYHAQANSFTAIRKVVRPPAYNSGVCVPRCTLTPLTGPRLVTRRNQFVKVRPSRHTTSNVPRTSGLLRVRQSTLWRTDTTYSKNIYDLCMFLYSIFLFFNTVNLFQVYICKKFAIKKLYMYFFNIRQSVLS